MNGGDLYEPAKILGRANLKRTECYAKLGRKHIVRAGNTTRELWKLMETGEHANTVGRDVRVWFARLKFPVVGFR
ncbi:MAG: hypothetical protein WCD70_08055 [Alphaproteobacteria bacterium]